MNFELAAFARSNRKLCKFRWESELSKRTFSVIIVQFVSRSFLFLWNSRLERLKIFFPNIGRWYESAFFRNDHSIYFVKNLFIYLFKKQIWFTSRNAKKTKNKNKTLSYHNHSLNAVFKAFEWIYSVPFLVWLGWVKYEFIVGKMDNKSYRHKTPLQHTLHRETFISCWRFENTLDTLLPWFCAEQNPNCLVRTRGRFPVELFFSSRRGDRSMAWDRRIVKES